MAAKDRPGLRKVAPGLYESADGYDIGRLTQEYAAAVRKHTGSTVLEQIVEKAAERQERRTNQR